MTRGLFLVHRELQPPWRASARKWGCAPARCSWAACSSAGTWRSWSIITRCPPGTRRLPPRARRGRSRANGSRCRPCAPAQAGAGGNAGRCPAAQRSPAARRTARDAASSWNCRAPWALTPTSGRGASARSACCSSAQQVPGPCAAPPAAHGRAETLVLRAVPPPRAGGREDRVACATLLTFTCALTLGALRAAAARSEARARIVRESELDTERKSRPICSSRPLHNSTTCFDPDNGHSYKCVPTPWGAAELSRLTRPGVDGRGGVCLNGTRGRGACPQGSLLCRLDVAALASGAEDVVAPSVAPPGVGDSAQVSISLAANLRGLVAQACAPSRRAISFPLAGHL